MKDTIAIGIYHSDGKLLGYKVDTFWSLSQDKADAKPHIFDEKGEIPDNIIGNLSQIVTRNMGPLAFFSAETVHKISSHKGLRVGYEQDGSDKPVITHMIEATGVHKISP
jgi:hypothetical protein